MIKRYEIWLSFRIPSCRYSGYTSLWNCLLQNFQLISTFYSWRVFHEAYSFPVLVMECDNNIFTGYSTAQT